MLTKDDLKQIRSLVREEVGNEVQASKDDLDSTIRDARMRVQVDVRGLADRVKNLEIRVTRNHKEVLSKLERTSDFLDRENLKVVKRVEQIEEELRLPAKN